MGPRSRGATLAAIAAAVEPHQPVTVAGGEIEVTDVHMDSRVVTPGSLYVAIRGQRTDGHQFVESALAAGAVAVAVETAIDESIPHLVTPNTRAVLGWMAAETHGHPARELGVVGITGTNGKTTVAHMLAAMNPDDEPPAAVIGTVSAHLGDLAVSPRTTPEASDLQRILRHLADSGQVRDVAIEVSSHAMAMGRVTGVEFDVVAFTNLSQDHLDYHHTMEEYYQAKASLFRAGWAPHGVIWIDDRWGRRLAEESEIPVVTVGTAADAAVVVTHLEDTATGSRFTINLAGGTVPVQTSLAGGFNVANAAIALTCAHLLGADMDAALAGLRGMQPIPGRYNTVAADSDVWVVVDYAHTPDAIASVVAESRKLVAGRTIVVVGAGGDRDREKRPKMGEAAATADVAIITTDNPRSEDPNAIIDEVVSGIPSGARFTVVRDRRAAIREALGIASPGDAVLILGKGHETSQEFADRVEHFDDGAVARQELDRLSGASA